MSVEFTIKKLDSLQSVSPEAWNLLTDGSNPFVQHQYLYGLEQYGCLDGHGWSPCHLAVYSDATLVGALPLYLRSNSYGEFVFDWAWADAYERSGRKYYPKLVTAIPFAPVIGPRLLTRPGLPASNLIKHLLLEQVIQMADRAELSSWHCLFPDVDVLEEDVMSRHDLLQRISCQFHWSNEAYRDFEDFLDALTSKKRKQIKKERKSVHDSGIEIERIRGDQITEEQWSVFYDFYCSTFLRRWGSPRLTLDFFQALGRSMPTQTLLIMAKHGKSYVAGAFAMLGKDTLYGRHWGCTQQFSFLHFEVCYYQTIDYCIKNGLKRVDAGVQGEHKLARGFRPVGCVSWHWIRDPEFRDAIGKYLQMESSEMKSYLDSLNEHL
ncbi:MAG: GNAT family N-acetyltransferase, partial [Gammaproteobacteria bacterium]